MNKQEAIEKLTAMTNCNYTPQAQLYEYPILADHAIAWWREQGLVNMPHRDTQELLVLYQAWAIWAFDNISTETDS